MELGVFVAYPTSPPSLALKAVYLLICLPLHWLLARVRSALFGRLGMSVAACFPRAGFLVPASLVITEVFLDVFTTQAALSAGATEKNPLAVVLILAFGVVGFSFFKLAVCLGLVAALGFAAWKRQDARLRRRVAFGLWFLFVVYLYVVLCNLQVILV
jgi:hypothetical protein